jgi:uncharacterized membrane protein
MPENNYSKLKITGIALLSIGLLLIGIGITGNIILSSYTSSDYCEVNMDCANGKICCFSQGNSGMCYEPDVCDRMKSTLEGTSEISVRQEYSQVMTFGITAVVLAIVLLILIYILETKKRKHSAGNKTKKKR